MDQEMSSLTTVSVSLYGDTSSLIKVQVSVQPDQTVSVDNVFTRVCKTIGLQEVSWPWFTLVEGNTQPVRRLPRTDTLTLPCPELCLRKWVFDTSQERVLQVDMVAMELLCKQAQYHIFNGDLHPSKDISQKLADCLEPGFSAECQYVILCHQIPDYTAIYCHNCELQRAFSPLQLEEKACITLIISTRGLHCLSGEQKEADLLRWTAIKSWSHSVEQLTLTFDLMILGSSSTLCICTKQTSFMLAVILEIVKILQKKTGRRDVRYFASDIHRVGDLLTWDNLLYEPGTENPVFEPSTPTDHKDFLS